MDNTNCDSFLDAIRRLWLHSKEVESASPPDACRLIPLSEIYSTAAMYLESLVSDGSQASKTLDGKEGQLSIRFTHEP
jgi:hypothetical protein